MLALGIIGLSLAIWRSLTAQKQANAALAQSNTAIRQAEIAESGQRFDRYARAAEMLDSEKAPVRQAGIILLRSLALTDKTYRTSCIELLASFIRSRIADDLGKLMSKGTVAKTELAGQETPHDIADALHSLCQSREGIAITVNLRDSVFAKISFDHTSNMASFNLGRSVFSNTSGYGVTFDDSELTSVKFQHLTLHQANLRDIYFYETHFENVDFEDVDFTGSIFSYCSFKNCNFSNCNISGVRFDSNEDATEPMISQEELKKGCWIWKNRPPKTEQPFLGTLYDPGEAEKERKGFDERREKRRLGGLNYQNLRPNVKLKVLQ